LDPNVEQPPKIASVYFIQAGGPDGPVKIGSSFDVSNRLSTFQIGNHVELYLLGSYRVTGADIWEIRLHRRLEASCIRGEWYAWSDAIAAAMAEMAERERTDPNLGRLTARDVKAAEQFARRPIRGPNIVARLAGPLKPVADES
jgi:hypothetical protein